MIDNVANISYSSITYFTLFLVQIYFTATTEKNEAINLMRSMRYFYALLTTNVQSKTCFHEHINHRNIVHNHGIIHSGNV